MTRGGGGGRGTKEEMNGMDTINNSSDFSNSSTDANANANVQATDHSSTSERAPQDTTDGVIKRTKNISFKEDVIHSTYGTCDIGVNGTAFNDCDESHSQSSCWPFFGNARSIVKSAMEEVRSRLERMERESNGERETRESNDDYPPLLYYCIKKSDRKIDRKDRYHHPDDSMANNSNRPKPTAPFSGKNTATANKSDLSYGFKLPLPMERRFIPSCCLSETVESEAGSTPSAPPRRFGKMLKVHLPPPNPTTASTMALARNTAAAWTYFTSGGLGFFNEADEGESGGKDKIDQRNGVANHAGNGGYDLVRHACEGGGG
eukprot:CAMPEP_0175039074 /NCGR_PEP_ID=MMETSP0052_2-20121109/310_1 /TAXON_ID=51329 ORGANISM="Polytomella parva, Strain SAG 63-3" /NCGR_SAMPLE_ID=MMETSP0052_2 /ASSEMBLY_ACC=CAM_ASM_000194 /LENGTH=318 /DNA_ID=CAMNT_0016300743 /DNA_START=159 /DNA_END=1112 /DNA_ORIENTATION=+